jgi:hypothetical protein
MTINRVIKEQEDFVTQVSLTLLFLYVYKNNPTSFDLLFTKKVKDEYSYEKYKSNPEYLWETFEEITSDIIYGTKKFALKHNGIFFSLDFAGNKKKKSTVEEIFYQFSQLADGPWDI